MDDFRVTPRQPRPGVAPRASVAPRQPASPVAAPAPLPVSPAPATTQGSAPLPSSAPTPESQAAFVPQPLSETPSGLDTPSPKKSRKKPILIVIFSLIGLGILAFVGLFAWYNAELSPVDSGKTDRQLFTVQSGSSPSQIAAKLEESKLIRNKSVFLFNARLQGVENNLQAGTYRLTPSESTPEIISHLVSGKVDTFTITFLPGATLADNRKVLIGAGYSPEEVDEAFLRTYDSPLFEGKPAGAGLEGYIYGETYSFGTNTSVEAILEHTFEEYYKVIQENNLIAQYQAQGFTLYEGITLASIIQREASPSGTDMPQIAQVFYSRLAQGMPLGSDVTYQYIADKTGVQRDPTLDSPYNTRRYPGLPPGPISAPGKKALIATGAPAQGDYLYFLSGDDDVTYYGRTLNEHEANITNHCQKKCQIL